MLARDQTRTPTAEEDDDNDFVDALEAAETAVGGDDEADAEEASNDGELWEIGAHPYEPPGDELKAGPRGVVPPSPLARAVAARPPPRPPRPPRMFSSQLRDSLLRQYILEEEVFPSASTSVQNMLQRSSQRRFAADAVDRAASRLARSAQPSAKKYIRIGSASNHVGTHGLRIVNRCKTEICVMYGVNAQSYLGHGQEIMFMAPLFLGSQLRKIVIVQMYSKPDNWTSMHINPAQMQPLKANTLVVRRDMLRKTLGPRFLRSTQRKRDALRETRRAAAIKLQAFFRGLLVRMPTRCHNCWMVSMRSFTHDVVPSSLDQLVSEDLEPDVAQIIRDAEKPGAEPFGHPPASQDYVAPWPVSFVWRALQPGFFADDLDEQKARSAHICLHCLQASIWDQLLSSWEGDVAYPGLPNTFMHKVSIRAFAPPILIRTHDNIVMQRADSATLIQAAWRGCKLRRPMSCPICIESVPRGFMVQVQHSHHRAAPQNERMQRPRRRAARRRNYATPIERRIARRPNLLNVVDFMEDSDGSDDEETNQLPGQDAPEVDECSCCRACWKEQIRVGVEDGLFNIRCPFYSTCSSLLSKTTITELGGQALCKKLEDNRGRNHADYVASLRNGASDPLFLAWANDNTRVCPECSVVIYRYRGCDHMVCTCGKSFDWSRADHKLNAPVPEKALQTKATKATADAAEDAPAPVGQPGYAEVGWTAYSNQYPSRPRRRSFRNFVGAVRRLVPV